MEKLTEINLMYDFYGMLLTEKQQKLIELYYCHDFSLGEISGQFGVSRQSVYDVLKRSEQSLYKFEQKLGLVAKSLAQREMLAQALSFIKKGGKEDLANAGKILSEIIDAEESQEVE